MADAGNDRVLEFNPPFVTGMSASLELGFPSQVGMSSPTPFADGWTCPPNAYLCGPAGLAFESQGDLWVSDSGNNRVLEFLPPFTSGMAASLVIGQPDATGRNPQPTAANSLNDPSDLTFDASGDLIVADVLNNRILIFLPPFSNGMSASVVLGQTNMSTGAPHGCGDWTTGSPKSGDPNASTFCHPEGVLAF